MSEFAAFGCAHRGCLAYREAREVVVEHKGFVLGSRIGQVFKHLRVFAPAYCQDDKGLCLASGKETGGVCVGKNIRLDRNRANLGQCTPVGTHLLFNDLLTHTFSLVVDDRRFDLVVRPGIFFCNV